MYANAIYATGEGPCGRVDLHELGSFLHAMSGCSPKGGRGRHRHRGFGAGAGGLGFGGFSPGGPRGRGRKARRGDIRMAALLLLAEEPRNGYQIMQEVEERSDGVWRPSPGSVYPALAQLEDEGLIRSEETDGRKLFALTEEGRAYVQEREQEQAPWQQMRGEVSEEASELRSVIREVLPAFGMIMRTGSKAQLAQAHTVLVTARRELYRILADGEPESTIVDDDA